MQHAIAGDYSTLMLAARITLPHLPPSSMMNCRRSAGELGNGTPPKSAMRALMSGSARAVLIALLSLSIVSAGESLGAPTPNHALASKSGTNSLTVGMSGIASQRAEVV